MNISRFFLVAGTFTSIGLAIGLLICWFYLRNVQFQPKELPRNEWDGKALICFPDNSYDCAMKFRNQLDSTIKKSGLRTYSDSLIIRVIRKYKGPAKLLYIDCTGSTYRVLAVSYPYEGYTLITEKGFSGGQFIPYKAGN